MDARNLTEHRLLAAQNISHSTIEAIEPIQYKRAVEKGQVRFHDVVTIEVTPDLVAADLRRLILKNRGKIRVSSRRLLRIRPDFNFPKTQHYGLCVRRILSALAERS